MRQHPARIIALVALLAITLGSCDNTPQPLPTEGEIQALIHLHDASLRVRKELEKKAAIFDRPDDTPLTPDERATLLPLWASLIDHFLAFHSYKGRFLYHWENAPEDPEGPVMCLTMGLGAHASQMAEALELLTRIGGNVAIRRALNEASPEYGVSAGYLDRISIEVVSHQSLMILDIGENMLDNRSDKLFEGDTKVDQDLRKSIKYTFDAINEVNRLYNKAGMDLVKGVVRTLASNEFNRVLSPLVEDIAAWLGDTMMRQSGTSLISEADLDQLLPDLASGDIILERRNWYLSNLGLPGFWPHSALYVGSPEELAATFDNDPDVLAVYPDGLTAYLEATYPEQWGHYAALEDGQPHRVIEAVSEGVVFATLYHSCLADYVSIMRPIMPPLSKARAIDRAFSHWGKPYDFDFDFLTRSELVCSELVYFSYQAATGEGKSLDLTLSDVMGRITLPPNDIVKQFDAEYGTANQQLEFVAFLDGDEGDRGAVFVGLEEFRASWLRPKWDLAQD